jgi:hypothetical protein
MFIVPPSINLLQIALKIIETCKKFERLFGLVNIKNITRDVDSGQRMVVDILLPIL